MLEVGRLAPEARAVIDELTVDLAGRVVDHRHGRVPLTKEFVNFVLCPFEQALLLCPPCPPCPPLTRSHPTEHPPADFFQLPLEPLGLEPHSPERRTLLVEHHADHA